MPDHYVIDLMSPSYHFYSGGRVVAIKKIPRNDLIVNHTVRKEVMQIR
jgi:hypothetical protein